MAMYWPIALIVISNIFYHVCSKQTPKSIDPLASLTVTYAVAALTSAVLYFILSPQGNLLREYRQLNWTSFVLGAAVVGLEAGSIYMYKLGWNVNSGQLTYSSILTIALIVIGYFAYGETLSPRKLVGVAVCMLGLFLINK